jgi:hypothetical protein
MSRRRIYPKVEGAWVYCFVTPDQKFYIGQSQQDECHDRWQVTNYIDNSSMRPYILKYGWQNIKKMVLKDGLTPEEAVILEGMLIKAAKDGGWCINDHNSGYVTRDMKEYEAQRRQKPERQEYLKKWADNNREYRAEYSRQWYHEHKDLFIHKPENVIYHRVRNYNKTHDAVETPLQAKQKYLATGYIPNYINPTGLE